MPTRWRAASSRSTSPIISIRGYSSRRSAPLPLLLLHYTAHRAHTFELLPCSHRLTPVLPTPLLSRRSPPSPPPAYQVAETKDGTAAPFTAPYNFLHFLVHPIAWNLGGERLDGRKYFLLYRGRNADLKTKDKSFAGSMTTFSDGILPRVDGESFTNFRERHEAYKSHVDGVDSARASKRAKRADGPRRPELLDMSTRYGKSFANSKVQKPRTLSLGTYSHAHCSLFLVFSFSLHSLSLVLFLCTHLSSFSLN